MPTLDTTLPGLVVGDDYSITRTVTSVPSGTTISKAYFMVKTAASDADGSALINLSITSTGTSSGQITDSGASGTGTLLFTVSHTQTATLKANTAYAYGIKVIFANAASDHVETGTVTPRTQVISATT